MVFLVGWSPSTTGAETARGKFKLEGELGTSGYLQYVTGTDFDNYGWLWLQEGLSLKLSGFVWKKGLALFDAGGRVFGLHRLWRDLADNGWGWEASARLTILPFSYLPLSLYAARTVTDFTSPTNTFSLQQVDSLGLDWKLIARKLPRFFLRLRDDTSSQELPEKQLSEIYGLLPGQNFSGRNRSLYATVVHTTKEANVRASYSVQQRSYERAWGAGWPRTTFHQMDMDSQLSLGKNLTWNTWLSGRLFRFTGGGLDQDTAYFNGTSFLRWQPAENLWANLNYTFYGENQSGSSSNSVTGTGEWRASKNWGMRGAMAANYTSLGNDQGYIGLQDFLFGPTFRYERKSFRIYAEELVSMGGAQAPQGSGFHLGHSLHADGTWVAARRHTLQFQAGASNRRDWSSVDHDEDRYMLQVRWSAGLTRRVWAEIQSGYWQQYFRYPLKGSSMRVENFQNEARMNWNPLKRMSVSAGSGYYVTRGYSGEGWRHSLYMSCRAEWLPMKRLRLFGNLAWFYFDSAQAGLNQLRMEFFAAWRLRRLDIGFDYRLAVENRFGRDIEYHYLLFHVSRRFDASF
ncbi:MAG: hypothetical protein D6806_06480 [Deltaproteobacteria bacterium]|nr:MAG: hypothetical protein D6806_06480 [Deltaproteobacteria bacterium]